MEQTLTNSPRLPLGKALLFSALIVIAVAVAYTVINHSHAVESHGDEAVAVRAACNKGPEQFFVERGRRDVFFELCQTADGRWGVRVIQKIGQRVDEITSYICQGGNKIKCVQYLLRKATKISRIP
jgi:hypothetical protein